MVATMGDLGRERFVAELQHGLAKVPERLRGGLERYLCHGTKPGGFLSACIVNNALEAATRADSRETLLALPDIMKFLFNDCPSNSWGSKTNFEVWMKAGGKFGGEANATGD